MSPSTTTPEAMPKIATLRRITQSLAMLDALASRECEFRCYSYNSKWGAGEEMASMRNGSGDDWFLLFNSYGAALKGFAHESPLAASSSIAELIQTHVPAGFSSFLNEPAFTMNRATFCLWCRCGEPAWSVVATASHPSSESIDGSLELLRLLDGEAVSYHQWAESYFECTIPLHAVQALYEHRPLDADLIHAINPNLSLSDASSDAIEIGYPLAS